MTLRIAVATAALALSAAAAVAGPPTFVVDKAHSEAGFKVRHLLSKTAGRFTDFDGRIQLVEYRPRVLEGPPLAPTA